jgi:GDPmannose 4,6-dehydratase
MKKKIAIVTGSSGQDGSYLCELLLKKKYTVIACDRRSARDNNWRHEFLKINANKNLKYYSFDLQDYHSIIRLFKSFKFDEFYNLAAQSFVKESFENPLITADITGLGVLRILDCLKTYQPKVKFYQASTSEMFGNTNKNIQNEETKFNPKSPYGIAKLFAHELTKNYREAYGIFACSGILFNHESPLRGIEFVTKKIVSDLVQIKFNKKKLLEVGNIYAKRDWGYAKDYVEAMWKILQQKKPNDYVICTGQTITVKEFINLVLKKLNFKFKWTGKGINEKAINLDNKKTIIKINRKFFRPAEVDYLKGSNLKAKKILKWKPKTKIDELVKIMVDAEIKIKKHYL